MKLIKGCEEFGKALREGGGELGETSSGKAKPLEMLDLWEHRVDGKLQEELEY